MNELPPIPESATVSQWQTYVAQVVKARGWDSASDLEIFLLFSEEVGELAKALRRHRDLFRQADSSTLIDQTKKEVALEMADVASYLLDLAARLEIDLEAAMVEKERLNRHREWL